ncbi:GGDEF domain-containing protein [Sulfurimonas sp. SAG-AH-194-I05]|nr:GGDEF domain-containing protein [Sulfurimonas sp. SAG-AH-194-I05]MDF1875063.1 GGDEF domain-containing protein [Sulfurimonas sp. SAG-AH-194-I05]
MKFHEEISREDLLELYKKQSRRLDKIVARNDLQNKELLELNEQLIKLATLDPMTNIYNRRYLLEVAERYIKTSIREKSDLCVIMLDIDHFKNINDTYGHDVGDKVIIACTEIITANIRDTDVFARFGGEEFVVLFPNTTTQGAFEISDKIRKLIEANILEGNISVTMSTGLTIFKNEGEDIDVLIKQADLGLYHAKEHGRNQVVDYTSLK